MAIQYYMRGYNTSAPGTVGYVDWVVNDTPDSTATYVPSPYSSVNIANIVVNRTVTSKVDNFLKPNESLSAIGITGSDGYFFHINSYDWLHTTPPGPPIPVPSHLLGLSMVRGSADGITPRDYSTLFWSESLGKWLFAYNTNGDGVTIGAALPVGMGSLSIDGYIEVGTNPAHSGIIRIPNNQFIVSRSANNLADGYLIGQDNLNRVRLGSPPGNEVYIPGDLRVDGYIRDGGAVPATTGFVRNSNGTSIVTFKNLSNVDVTALSSSGNLVVLGDAVNAGVRLNTATGFEHIFQVNTTNIARIGANYFKFENTSQFPSISQFDTGAGNGQDLKFKAQTTTFGGSFGGSAVISSGHGPSADGYVDLRVNDLSKVRLFGAAVPVTPDAPDNQSNNPNSIQLFNPIIRWYDTLVSSPTISQDPTLIATSSATGQTLTIQSQSTPGPTSIAGNMVLKTGTGTAINPASSSGPAYTKHGRLFFEIGPNSSNSVGEFFVDGYGPYISIGGGTSAPAAIDGYVRVPNNVWAVSAARNPATVPSASIHLIGTNSSNQILIGESTDTTYVPGTLIVGTFNSSTVLEVEDRIIHANFNVAQAGTAVAPPTAITGLTIHRGNSAVPVYNDEAGLIWVEGVNLDASDGYWKAASVLAGNDTNLSTSLNMMARSLSITNTPSPVLGSLPGVGGLRTQRNTVAVSSRNLTSTLDLVLLGTDNSNRVIHGDGYNSGHIFNTSTGSVYDFQVNSVSNKIMVGDGYIRAGALPSTIGVFRNSQTPSVNNPIVASRNFANSLDLALLSTDGYDRVVHGDTSNKAQIFDTAIDGYYDFRANSSSTLFVDGYKVAFQKGRRRHITPVSTTYQVLVTDDYLAIDASTIYTITMPANPVIGDAYEFKDVNGTATTNNVTIAGNGKNIDGASTFVMNTNFASFVLTYTGVNWSVS